MDKYNLKEWVIRNNIKRKSIEGFWYCFNKYIEEDKLEFEKFSGNFNKNKLFLAFREVRLTVRNWDEADDEYWHRFEDDYNPNYEFIDALMEIYYDTEQIGDYTLRFDIQGKSFDDFLKLDWKDWAVYIENQVKCNIIKSALNEGLSLELIEKIVGTTKN